MVGQALSCVVSGANLTNTNIRGASPACPSVSVVGSGSSTQQTLSCVPTVAGTTQLLVLRADTGATLQSQPLVVGTAQTVPVFNEAFDGSGLGTSFWTVSGAPTMSGGVATFPAFGSASTQGKVLVRGNSIVIEARMAGTGSGRDTSVRLIDATTGEGIQFGDTNYRQPANTGPDGMYIAASGTFNVPQRGNGVTVSTYKEYRLTLAGTSLTLERGDMVGNYTERLTATLGSSIAGRTFFVRIGTGAVAFSPGSFDRLSVVSDQTASPPTPLVITNAEGWWTGLTSNGRNATTIVLDNGTYWVLYSVPGTPTVIGGGLQGTVNASGGSYVSTDAIDANFNLPTIIPASITGTYVPRQTLTGTVTETALVPPTTTFNAVFNPAYDQVPSLAAIAGTFTGLGVVVGGSEPSTLTISSTGALSGSGSLSGCRFSGTVAPRARGNVYNVSVTFAGGTCSNGTSTVTGIAYYDAGIRQWVGAGVNATRTNGFIFSGTKP